MMKSASLPLTLALRGLMLAPTLLPLLLVVWTTVWAAPDPTTFAVPQFPADCPWFESSACSRLTRPESCCNTTDRCSGLPVSYHCPITCGLCPGRDSGPPCGGMDCQNSGTLDYETCTCQCKGHMSGSYCEVCGEDEKWCHNFKPREMCGKTMGINSYLCPHYCGLCPNTCGGKKCSNLGRLNIKSCECECLGLFTGPTCETCPTHDHHVCLHTSEEWCAQEPYMFSLVQTYCPYMCGLCQPQTTMTS